MKQFSAWPIESTRYTVNEFGRVNRIPHYSTMLGPCLSVDLREKTRRVTHTPLGAQSPLLGLGQGFVPTAADSHGIGQTPWREPTTQSPSYPGSRTYHETSRTGGAKTPLYRQRRQVPARPPRGTGPAPCKGPGSWALMRTELGRSRERTRLQAARRPGPEGS